MRLRTNDETGQLVGKITLIVRKIALLGTHAPRWCGIAAFTDDRDRTVSRSAAIARRETVRDISASGRSRSFLCFCPAPGYLALYQIDDIVVTVID